MDTHSAKTSRQELVFPFILTLLHSKKLKLHTFLVFLSALELINVSLLSTPMGVHYVVIGFDMEVLPLVTHNAA